MTRNRSSSILANIQDVSSVHVFKISSFGMPGKSVEAVEGGGGRTEERSPVHVI
jgi:hypothetical protein